MQKLDYFIIYDYTDVLQNLYQSSWHFISYVLFIQLLLIYIQKQKHYLDMSCNLVTFSSSLFCINIQIIQWSAFYWLCSRVRLWWIDTFFNNAFVFLTYAKRQISLIYDPLFKSYVHTWIHNNAIIATSAVVLDSYVLKLNVIFMNMSNVLMQYNWIIIWSL